MNQSADYYCNREGIHFGSDSCFDVSSGPSRFPNEKDVSEFRDSLRNYAVQMKTIG